MGAEARHATASDYIACLLLPFWGLIAGLVLVIVGQRNRGSMMLLVGVVWSCILLAAFDILR